MVKIRDEKPKDDTKVPSNHVISFSCLSLVEKRYSAMPCNDEPYVFNQIFCISVSCVVVET